MHGVLTQTVGDGSLLAAFSLAAMWNSVWPYLLMVLGFSVIVFVHELGHFAVAKWAGVRVQTFAVGFGREIFGFTRGETRYSFNVLPLGGYVKMLGQEDFDDKTNELKFKADPRSFANKPVAHRMAIVSAGVIMNTLFACFLFMIIFMVGMEAAGTTVGAVLPDTPADKAGLLPGDKITSINGKRMLEFNEVRMGILLAAPHEPIDFVVERDGIEQSILVTPDYRRPQSTADIKRNIVGILPGMTRTIVAVGPTIDTDQPNQPHVGDVIVEMDGVPVTDDNINQLQTSLAAAKDIWIERKSTKDPQAAPERIRVDIPPLLALYPSDSSDADTVSLHGLTPLFRFGFVDPDKRGALAGLEVGDTVLNWDDIDFPSKAAMARAIRHNAERDVFFRVLKADGRIVTGFVRPKKNRHGAATIQATVKAIPEDRRNLDGPKAHFTYVRTGGRADRAGIKAGDEVLLIDEQEAPSYATVNELIRSNTETPLQIAVRRPDGSVLRTMIRPQVPGSIDASYGLVADDLLQTGPIVETINGKPSAASVASIPAGAKITAVAGQAVNTWRQLIEVFRAHAGETIELTYTPPSGATVTASFAAPHSLRTLLGVGPEARIVSIDGKTTAKIARKGETEEVHIGYHGGLRTALTALIGRTNVPVKYRVNAVGPLETKHIDITADMVDPWLARVAFAPNIAIGTDLTLLKGENAFDAVKIGIHKTYSFIEQVYLTIKRMVVTRSVGVENLSGPLGIVSIGGDIARAGFLKFLYFMAIISANLAVINFLPLPIVDGGLMVFLIIEKIKGSPVSIRVQVATQMIGVFLLLGVFLFITYNDALRIWG